MDQFLIAFKDWFLLIVNLVWDKIFQIEVFGVAIWIYLVAMSCFSIAFFLIVSVVAPKFEYKDKV